MAAEPVVWRPRAREDLLEIYIAIGLDGPAAAERVFHAIETKIAHLAEYPRLGPRRSDIRPSARM